MGGFEAAAPPPKLVNENKCCDSEHSLASVSHREAKRPSTLDPPTQARLRSTGVTTQTIEKQ